MSRYSAVSVDRRASYYARASDLIAADPLDFYTRAEKGRRFQATFSTEYERQRLLAGSPPQHYGEIQ